MKNAGRTRPNQAESGRIRPHLVRLCTGRPVAEFMAHGELCHLAESANRGREDQHLPQRSPPCVHTRVGVERHREGANERRQVVPPLESHNFGVVLQDGSPTA
jgi:hypothetical protein